MEPIPVLYDAECRFCRASLALVLAWDRHRRLRPVALQSEEARRLLPGMGDGERMSSVHIAPPGRVPVAGGAVAAPVLRELPVGAPLAWAAERVPRLAGRVYALVAANRGRLSGAVPAWLSRRADALVARRARAGR